MTVPTFSKSAETGFAAAALYDQHRPSYPLEAVETFLSRVEINGVQNARVVDLAAGTGKFTEILAQRPEKYVVTAVEPHAGMREQLEKKSLPNVTIINGTAEDMSKIDTNSVAAVVVAQGFHWIANMKALKEIHRVLQGTGVLGMIWNIEDYNAPLSWEVHAGWESTMRDVVHQYSDDVPRFREEKWQAVFDEQNAGNMLTKDPIFGLPLGEETVKRTEWLDKQAVWARFRTLSHIATLEGDELKKTEKLFWDSVNDEKTEVDQDGRVALHVTTFFAWCSKIPDIPLMSEQAM